MSGTIVFGETSDYITFFEFVRDMFRVRPYRPVRIEYDPVTGCINSSYPLYNHQWENKINVRSGTVTNDSIVLEILSKDFLQDCFKMIEFTSFNVTHEDFDNIKGIEISSNSVIFLSAIPE